MEDGIMIGIYSTLILILTAIIKSALQKFKKKNTSNSEQRQEEIKTKVEVKEEDCTIHFGEGSYLRVISRSSTSSCTTVKTTDLQGRKKEDKKLLYYLKLSFKALITSIINICKLIFNFFL